MNDREHEKRITARVLAGKVVRMCRVAAGTFVARVAADLLRPEVNVLLERARSGPNMPPRRPNPEGHGYRVVHGQAVAWDAPDPPTPRADGFPYVEPKGPFVGDPQPFPRKAVQA